MVKVVYTVRIRIVEITEFDAPRPTQPIAADVDADNGPKKDTVSRQDRDEDTSRGKKIQWTHSDTEKQGKKGTASDVDVRADEASKIHTGAISVVHQVDRNLGYHKAQTSEKCCCP